MGCSRFLDSAGQGAVGNLSGDDATWASVGDRTKDGAVVGAGDAPASPQQIDGVEQGEAGGSDIELTPAGLDDVRDTTAEMRRVRIELATREFELSKGR
jgi:hypothetical protein